MKDEHKRDVLMLLTELRGVADDCYSEAAQDLDAVEMHRAWQMDSQVAMIMDSLMESDKHIQESIDWFAGVKGSESI